MPRCGGPGPPSTEPVAGGPHREGPTPQRYRTVAVAARGRELTRREMIALLVDAGYLRLGGRDQRPPSPVPWVGPSRYRQIRNRTDMPDG